MRLELGAQVALGLGRLEQPEEEDTQHRLVADRTLGLRLAEPGTDLGDAGVGGRVGLAPPRPLLDELDQALLTEPGELRVDLAVPCGPDVRERLLEVLGELVPRARAFGQQSEQREPQRHVNIDMTVGTCFSISHGAAGTRPMTHRPARGAIVLAAVLAAALLAPSASGAISGQLRVLYVLTTWGPMPFTAAETERVAAETDAFFRASSAGRLSMPGSVVGPLRLPREDFNGCNATALRTATPSSTFTGFDRVAFVTPIVDACGFFGEADPTEVLLNGRLFRNLAVHELGHTLGLGHASRWDCTGRACSVDEYGSAFSVMGGGDGDFNAYEKSQLGWLTGIIRPGAAESFAIGPIEGPTTLPQALVVTTAGSEFWFESRGLETRSFMGDGIQPPGIAVVAGPAQRGGASPYPRENLLLPNPDGGHRYTYVAGESYVRPGVFRVTVERHSPATATLGFRWLDRTAPARPRLRVRALKRGRVRLTWDSARDRGSGVDGYTLLVDGRVARVVREEIPLVSWEATLRAPRGRHRVGVLAIDRAGNRGRAATVRVRVR